MDLRFECGWLAGERGWVDASVVVPSELGVQAPHGGPLVIEAAVGSLNVADAKVIGALVAAGRQCLVVSEGELSPEVGAWIPTETIHIAGGPRKAAVGVPVPFVDPGFADYLNLGPMGEEEGEELLCPDPEVARLLSGMSVRFAWDRPILWSCQEGDDGGYSTSSINTDLQVERDDSFRGLFRDVPDLPVVRTAVSSNFRDAVNSVNNEEAAFCVGKPLRLRSGEFGSPALYLSVHVGSGRAVLACTFTRGGRRVYFAKPPQPTFPDGSVGVDFYSELNLIASGDWGEELHGIPEELSGSRRAQEVVEGILGSVATGIYCAVVAYGMRQLVLNTEIMDRKLQEAWQQSIARVAGG